MPLFTFRLPSAPALIAALSLILSGCSTISSMTPDIFKSKETVAANNTSGVQTLKERRFLGILSPYRVDIQQGNFVSREMVAQLKEGMKDKGGLTPEQVRFVMGTPLINDIFHQDRWDYVFRLEKNNGDILLSKITVMFENGRLRSVEGGENLPNEQEYLALIAGKDIAAAKPAPKNPAAAVAAPQPAPATPPAAPAASSPK